MNIKITIYLIDKTMTHRTTMRVNNFEIDLNENSFYTFPMKEAKHCWQIDYLSKPTPCFKNAGSVVCETDGCTVDDAVERLIEKKFLLPLIG